MTSSASSPTINLNNGIKIPQLGFGVFQVIPEQTYETVQDALQTGYRHIDTAAMYGNEEQVGKAIAQSAIARDEIFVTTKLDNSAQGYDQTLRGFDTSMKKLGLDVLDLYLIHWPLPMRDHYIDSYKAMEKLHGEGAIRAIGVSNFQPAHLDRILEECDIVPALNQIELHPWLSQQAMRDADRSRDIITEAWSPIARGGELLSAEELITIGETHAKSAAQVVLRWHIQLGNVVIPRSVTPSRIAENFDLFDFELSEAEMNSINAMDKGLRIGPDPDTFDPR